MNNENKTTQPLTQDEINQIIAEAVTAAKRVYEDSNGDDDDDDDDQTYINHVEELTAAVQTYDHAKIHADADKQNTAFQSLQATWDRACEFLTATNQCRIQMRRDVDMRMGIA